MDASKRRAALVTAIVLVQLIVVYLLVSSLQLKMKREFTSNAEVTLNKLADDIVFRSQTVLKPIENAVNVGVTLLSEQVLNTNDDHELELFFQSYLNSINWLSGMFLGRTDGSFVYVARNQFGLRTKIIAVTNGKRTVKITQRDLQGNRLESWIDAEDDYDPRTRVWYTNAKESGSLIWTEPYTFFSSGLPGLSVSTVSGENAVLGADVDIQQLSAYSANIPNSNRGSAIIVDDTQHAIAYSDNRLLKTGINASDIPSIEDIVDPALQALYKNGKRKNAEQSLDQQHLINLEVEGQTHLGLIRTFSLLQNRLNWILLVQVPADDYSGGAVSLFNQRTQLFGTLSLALGVLTVLGTIGLQRAARRFKPDLQTDPVTGALWYSDFETRLIEKIETQAGSEPPEHCVVMLIECRNLGYLVDRAGQEVESAIMRTLSQTISSQLSGSEFLGRTNDNRFIFVLVGSNRDELIERIQSLHRRVKSSSPITTVSGQQEVTINSGAAELEPSSPAATLVQRAREALSVSIEHETEECTVAESFYNRPDLESCKAA